jgi:ABC-type iron transport system FetAB ATPase subunit
MAAITPLNGVTFTTAEKNALMTVPYVEDLPGMQTSILNDLNFMVAKLNYIIGIMPAGANKTTLQTLVTTLS